jgi:signal transduction histidine kinase
LSLTSREGRRCKLQHIITNLVQNAIKYTDAGSVDLEISRLSPATWQICVRDTGRGIPAEHHAKIFEEFHRVPGTEGQQGTGLGLSIVKQLVTLLGGEIRVESQVGQGTTFCVILPSEVLQLPS